MKLHRCTAVVPLIVCFLISASPPLPAQIATHPVISEVYGGGGNAGARFRNDFIELYNPAPNPVVMNGWSVQYASASAQFTGTKTVFSGTIPARGFFLIQEAQGSGGTADLPAPDAAGSFNIASANGKVALASDTAVITGPDDPAVVDFVGFGTAAQYEGSAPAPAPSNTASIERKANSSSTTASMAAGGMDTLRGNGWDSGQNGADFLLRPFPDPQNSASPSEIPPAGGLAIGQTAASPFLPGTGAPDTVTVTVSGDSVAAVRLHVSVDRGADDSSVVMTATGSGRYRGVIPAQKQIADGALVEYFVSAVTPSGDYVSTASRKGGYFTGRSAVAAIKAHDPASVAGYAVSVRGMLGAAANLFAVGEGFLQDSTGGIRFYSAAAVPSFPAGRRLGIVGTVTLFDGAFGVSDPGFSLADTSLGSVSPTPAPAALPLAEQASSPLEGTLVTIANLICGAGGIFEGGNYLFSDQEGDTVTVGIASNGNANTIVGTPVPSDRRAITGILAFGGGSHRLLPRSAGDAGNAPVRTVSAAASGRWSDPAVWSGGAVPGEGDNVEISSSGVIVTIDLADARCGSLTLTGSGTSGGPVLKFDSSGAVGLTVNGPLAISGGSGSGQGGRAKLTSAGNASAVLTLKGNISTSTANSSSSGSAGLNMNEGTVIVSGPADTLRNSAGLRLGNLKVGDGVHPVRLVWAPSKSSTLAVRSLEVMNGAQFAIGSAADSNANDIGASTGGGVPTLTGGVTVDEGGALVVQPFPGGSSTASLNIDSGGIVNNGVCMLDTAAGPSAHSRYAIAFGGFTGAGKRSQTVSGSRPVVCGDIAIGASDTLAVRTVIRTAGVCTVNGLLAEEGAGEIVGTVTARRVVRAGTPEPFGGIGCTITAPDSLPDTTTVRRVTGAAVRGESGAPSILRRYDVRTQGNSPAGASMTLAYADADLNGQDASTLAAWRSEDSVHWENGAFDQTTDTSGRVLRISHITSFSLWAISDGAHPLGYTELTARYPVAEGWNLVSIPLKCAEGRKNVLFPTAISPAFQYIGYYTAAETLIRGVGYWLKFPSDGSCTLSGYYCAGDTILLDEGWNLIGSLSGACSTDAMSTEPAGIIASRFFRYEKGYVVSDTLLPCRGYWVKANGPGRLLRSSAGQAPRSGRFSPKGLRLTFSDGAGNRQSLVLVRSLLSEIPGSELPPAPPGVLLDARFPGNRWMWGTGGGVTGVPIVLRSQDRTIRLAWQSADRSISARLESAAGECIRLTGSEGETLLPGGREWRLVSPDDAGQTARFALGPNYPNPFNPATSISFTIPAAGFVTIEVTDIAGRHVRTLASAPFGAGTHTAVWNGESDSGVPAASGIYLITLRTGSLTAARKMLLIR